MWQENHTGSQISIKNEIEGMSPSAVENMSLTPLEEKILAFKPYPLPLANVEREDNFLSWERNSNFRQRYFELEELLEYAVESGKLDTPDLIGQVKALKKILYYTPPETVDELCEAEAELEKLYAIVAQMVKPVNIISLRTTSEEYPVKRVGWQKNFIFFLGSYSVARNFFRQFYWVGGLLTILMISVIVLPKEDELGVTVEPFLFGAIGAWLYLYKTLTSYATARILSRERVGFDWLRLFTGSLVGGLIVLLFKTTTEDFSDVSAAALGLLAGYSVDFFYQTLDQIIQRVLSKEREAVAPAPTPRQQQIEALLKQLKEVENEEDKIAIRNLLEKL